MGGEQAVPRVVVVALVQGDREISLGSVDRATRCDLGLVDDLLQLQVTAKRLGWSIRLTQVRADLRELFELVGLGDCLGHCLGEASGG
jgi:ABC-type transporter Mla MlaB component